MKMAVYMIILVFIALDLKQREEKKGWPIFLFLFPIAIPIYMFLRKDKSPEAKAREGMNTKIKIFIIISSVILLISYYMLYFVPYSRGNDYNQINQSFLIGLTILVIIVSFALKKRDYALCAVGIFICLLTIIFYLSLDLNTENTPKQSIVLEKGIFKIESDTENYSVTLNEILEKKYDFFSLDGRDEFIIKKGKGYSKFSIKPFSGYRIKLDSAKQIIFYEEYSNGDILSSHEITKDGFIDRRYVYEGYAGDDIFLPTIDKQIIYKKVKSTETYENSRYNTLKELVYSFKMDKDYNLVSNYVGYYSSNNKKYEIIPFNGKLNVKVVENKDNYDDPYYFTIKNGIETSYHENGVVEYKRIYRNGIYDGTYIYNDLGKIENYVAELSIKGNYGEYTGYLTVDGSSENIDRISTKIYPDSDSECYGSYFDYSPHEGNIIEISKYSDKKEDGKIYTVASGIKFIVGEKDFTYEITDKYEQETKKISIKNKVYTEFYYPTSKISFKFRENNSNKIEEAYIDYGDMKFHIKLEGGSYIVEAEFDKKYNPKKTNYIYNLKQDENND